VPESNPHDTTEAAGSTTQNATSSTGASGTTPPATTPPAPAGVSEADVQKAVEKAASKAKAEAKAEFDAFFAEQKRLADEAQLDEAGKANAEAQREREAAAADRAAAAKELHDAKVRRKLAAAGVPDAALDRAILLVTAAVGSTDDEIVADVEAVKATVPGLFVEQAPPTPGGPHVDPKNRPPGGQPAPSGLDKGRERARKEAEAAKSISPLDRFQVVGGPSVGGN
jgi:hypothetical protein